VRQNQWNKKAWSWGPAGPTALFALWVIGSFAVALFASAANAQSVPEKTGQGPPQEKPSGDQELNQEVTAPTKRAARISATPAIISVITASELSRMGAHDLYEALRYVPGIDLTETFFGFTSVGFRGILQTHYNNRSLVLLDGHPLFETYTGSYYLEQIPLDAVDRIEIVRGPGSTLYGTNAYAGVINVITKKPEDLEGGTIKLTGGSFSTYFPSFVAGKASKGLGWVVAGSVQHSSGYDYRVEVDEDGKSGAVDFRDNHVNALVSLRTGGFRAHFGYFDNDKDKFGLVPALVSSRARTTTGVFGDVSFEREVAKGIKLESSIYYDSYERKERIGWYPPAASQKAAGVGQPGMIHYDGGDKVGLDVHGRFDLWGHTSVIAGVMHEREHSGTAPFISDTTGAIVPTAGSWLARHDSDDTAVYVQIDTQLGSKVGVVGGLRYNENSEYGGHLSPRLGVVVAATDALSFKILYGNAFRNPNFFEKYVETVNVLWGDPNLKPEQIDTIDVGLDYMLSPLHNVRLNYFYIETDDIIARSRLIPAGQGGNTKPTPQYGNADGQKISGIEAEWRGWLTEHVFHFINVSFVKGEERSSGADVAFVPRYLANLGLAWKPSPRVSVAYYLHHVGEKKGHLVTAGTPEVTTDPYTLLNVTINGELGGGFAGGVTVKNLLNSAYSYPEYIRMRIAETPGGPGRAFYASLSYRFPL
jgi:outer membrane receptor protein involved in Fe transport